MKCREGKEEKRVVTRKKNRDCIRAHGQRRKGGPPRNVMSLTKYGQIRAPKNAFAWPLHSVQKYECPTIRDLNDQPSPPKIKPNKNQKSKEGRQIPH